MSTLQTRCSFPKCDKKVRSGYWCEGHHKQRQRGNGMRLITAPFKYTYCTFKGCEKAAYYNTIGLCGNHYNKQLWEKLADDSSNKCDLCDIKHYAKGYCVFHYRIQYTIKKMQEKICELHVNGEHE